MGKKNQGPREELLEIYRLLFEAFGPRHWWPAQTAFEVMVGAILTQNTAWSNVEKAIAALQRGDLLEPRALERADLRRLKRLIRPSGYFNQKAVRLKDFVRFFLAEPFRGSVERMAAEDPGPLRERLLSVKGIGPETADSILLYALGQPVFVVDAYTRRAFARLGYLPPAADYQQAQAFFTAHLPREVELYNDFHAQVVNLGKDFCRPRPRCEDCPLAGLGRCRVEDGEAGRGLIGIPKRPRTRAKRKKS